MTNTNKLSTLGFDLNRARDIGRKYYGKQEVEPTQEPQGEQTQQTVEPIILPTGNLEVVTDKNMFNEITKYIASDHPQLENKLTFADGVMKHSNSPLAVAVDMYLKKNIPEYRIATQADLETNLPMFKDRYVDSGLALRNLTGANKEQAEYLFNQLKSRGIKLEDFPLWINLRGLELDKNINFNLTDEALYKTAECLNWKSGTDYSEKDNFGLPEEEDKNSSRRIFTDLNSALSRCYLNWYSDLGSYDSGLAVSNVIGRVVLAKTR